jgi:hypothetical protein
MKKMLVFLMLGGLVFTGCGKEEEKKLEEKTDYSEYAFTDVNWVRDSGHDIETISFKADGSFSYTCACGNPVNDADLCETYTYNEETKEIKLDCFETTEETVTNIKIVEVSEDTLELDFNGEIRKFEKEK